MKNSVDIEESDIKEEGVQRREEELNRADKSIDDVTVESDNIVKSAPTGVKSEILTNDSEGSNKPNKQNEKEKWRKKK